MKNSIRKRIKEIKKELGTLEVIRPGKLSRQKRGTTRELYNYLSYTFQNTGRTEYVKGKYVEKINRETEDYRKFKELSDEWVELSIKLSRLEMEG